MAAGSLQLNIETSIYSRKRLTTSDLTGLFNATSNPYAWYASQGGPQPSVKDISTAWLSWVLPSGKLVVQDVLAAAKPLYNVVNGIINNPFVTLATDLGFEKFLDDGYYERILQVNGVYGSNDPQDEFSAIPSQVIYVTETVKCCVHNMFRKIDVCGCNCDDPLYIAAYQADGLLKTLEYAISCTDWTRADEVLTKLQLICASNGCGCGC